MTDNLETQIKPDNSTEENLPENKEKITDSTVINDSFVVKIRQFISSWQFKFSAIFLAIIGILLIIFFWQHIIAVQGLKGWAKHAQAKPVDCMMQDTNEDKYISCTAKLDNQVVPLECGTDILNMGCRVNYGNASPNIKLQQKSLNNG